MNAVDLRSVLADPEQSGAYFIDEHDTQAMVDAGNALDYAVLRVDLSGCTDKTELMRRFANAGEFPGWFGGNWDALSDVLGDFSWRRADGYVLLIEHASGWRAAHPDDFDTLLEILNETAFRWVEQGTAFWALLTFPADELGDSDD